MSNSFTQRISPLMLLSIWLSVIGLSAAFGLYNAYEEFGKYLDSRRIQDGVVTWASFGLGPATCLTLGLLAIARVKRGRWKKGLAVLGVFVPPLPCAVLSYRVLDAAQSLVPGFLEGERALGGVRP